MSKTLKIENKYIQIIGINISLFGNILSEFKLTANTIQYFLIQNKTMKHFRSNHLKTHNIKYRLKLSGECQLPQTPVQEKIISTAACQAPSKGYISFGAQYNKIRLQVAHRD